jgi:hypothetical protein
MKLDKSTWLAVALLVLVSAVSRIMSFHIAGLAPQMAMALFGGAIIKNKKWAFALPLASLLLSDGIMQWMYSMDMVDRPGFYDGQWTVYLCFAAVTVFGFLMKKVNVKNTILFGISGSLIFFILSNFFVWISGGGYGHPITTDGMLLCYGDALAFYRDYGLIHGFVANFVLGDLAWTAVLFGGYFLLSKMSFAKKLETA